MAFAMGFIVQQCNPAGGDDFTWGRDKWISWEKVKLKLEVDENGLPSFQKDPRSFKPPNITDAQRKWLNAEISSPALPPKSKVKQKWC